MSSLLEQEIYSQPEVITHLLEQETEHITNVVAQLPPFDYVLIAARGSSDHAATYAKYAWPIMAGYPIALAAPSLHTLYHKAPHMRNALIVGISQSGQSPDIVAVLEEGKRQGRPTLAITNDGSSPLAATADHVIELHAGRERSVAATKTYTAQLAVMMLFAAAWSGNPQRMTELQRLPEIMRQTLEMSAPLAQRAERYRYMDQCVVIGRGYNYATAFEFGLKLKELTYVMATSYSSADFRHGPIATVDTGLPVFLVAPRDATYDDMLDLARDLKQRGAELLVISEEQEILSQATTPLALPPAVPEWLSPITAILPGQVLALHLTLAKGLDPDVPRGLQKVTRTL
ncbi:glucosamine--fructose-6-phosphate aminotransferase [Ktedonobacter sp. SOSP1-52]|uniref:SIS domain-containing protein n=1 Tax=Ktedonobacter sp. SOSP1-52 TaxID=2778366 RepID=UPI0019156DFC|nr:SIS domain-containing protein [Ktedonobacter sp. SOSP1-52]GHO66078.1 glucosamine--fructose-6-phosphate aminotransferase [Ktedonobacter sp. SOSP1-52]